MEFQLLECWYILTSRLIRRTFPEPVGSHFSPHLHGTPHTAAIHSSLPGVSFLQRISKVD